MQRPPALFRTSELLWERLRSQLLLVQPGQLWLVECSNFYELIDAACFAPGPGGAPTDPWAAVPARWQELLDNDPDRVPALAGLAELLKELLAPEELVPGLERVWAMTSLEINRRGADL